jgi:hypothetical protein
MLEVVGAAAEPWRGSSAVLHDGVHLATLACEPTVHPDDQPRERMVVGPDRHDDQRTRSGHRSSPINLAFRYMPSCSSH